ncbi:MAG: hypothetical protein E7363_01670 [Clostridiales bacterium]|nr:hypothetical protein [Clostridiales bacterium]
MLGLCVDLPYPSVETLCTDISAAHAISPAYATLHGELSALLSYVYYAYYFEKEGLREYAETISQIALCEMGHFRLLGKALLQLGIDPVYTAIPPNFTRFYTTGELSYFKRPQQMLLDSISGEMQAIAEYKNMQKRLKNEDVSTLIARILLDEQLHLDTLNDLYRKLPKTKVR